MTLDIRKRIVYALRLETYDIPFYIGLGLPDRPRQHLSGREGNPNTLKNRIIDKAKREGIKILIDILYTDLSIEDARIKEKLLIAKYGRLDIGTGILANHTDGGDVKSEEAKSYWTEDKRKWRAQKSKEQYKNEEAREHNRKMTLKQFESEESRMAVAERTKIQMSNPEMLKKLSDSKKKLWDDPEYKKLTIEARMNKPRLSCDVCGRSDIPVFMLKRHKCIRKEYINGNS